MASTVVAVGLTIAAAGFAGRYVLQAMKHVEPQVKQVFQSLPKSAFSGGYYRGGFEPKMTKREAALILGVSPTANKGKIRDAHRRIMLLNHPDKGPLVEEGLKPIPICRSCSSICRRSILSCSTSYNQNKDCFIHCVCLCAFMNAPMGTPVRHCETHLTHLPQPTSSTGLTCFGLELEL
ncbi:similar to homolog of yeast TIM14 isoform c (predicted), isoform CRA_a [Rattus norvegicus]|uniref:Mitochondrial import inner membrane translocase subunit TIM14 n=1 Tax=Rattus norvegicus TaxID=10116 RepID=A6IHT6_RAT|nr:mitochondrial import inner membrane translocase subunit TIM14 [Rattus norvegicus]EDM01234.1 similar to homolog of yeast TIM14 isoform c (predicted), isoform CRA_a [Rattus norvegicus]|eukprot:NP_001128112.1 mitochondrial import inner membrane translocase subunit TIM14 [Rattus norvegicus]